jgi:hypothetical protein
VFECGDVGMLRTQIEMECDEGIYSTGVGLGADVTGG